MAVSEVVWLCDQHRVTYLERHRDSGVVWDTVGSGRVRGSGGSFAEHTFRVRLSSSVIWGGPCAGKGVSAGAARPEKDAAALAATRSACFCASRSACCLFRRSSSACTFT